MRFCLSLSVVLVVCAVSAQAQWEAGVNFGDPAAREYAVGLNQGGRLFAIGGLPSVAGGGTNTPAQYLDPNAAAWISAAPAEGTIVRQGAGIDDLGRIVVFGGVDAIDPNGGDPGQTYVYDIVEGQMQGLANRSGAAPRDYFAWATDAQGRVYSIGGGRGENASAAFPNSNHVERYIGALDTWETTANLPVAVADASAVYDGLGHIVVFGGIDATGSTRLATVQQYDVATGVWSTSAIPPMPAALSGHRAVLGADNRIYVIGGVSGPIGAGVTQNTVYVLHLPTLTWSTGQPMSVPRSHFAVALGDDDYIYVMGGANDSGGTNTVERAFTPVCPSVNQQPATHATWLNTVGAFSVAVDGAPPFTYQWRRDGVDLVDGPTAGGSIISGAASAALRIDQITAADAGAYDVVVTNACGSTTSIPAVLTVRIPPAIPTQWQVVNIHPLWAQMSSYARGIGNGRIGGEATTPTVLPDGRTFNLGHPVVWDVATLNGVDITPAGSVGGGIYDVEGDLLVGWFWHTWQCWSGGQYWTCAWQSAAFWTAPSYVFAEAIHSSGPEYDSIRATDGTTMVGTLTYDDAVGNYWSHAHMWDASNYGFSLHYAESYSTTAGAVDGAYEYGTARVGTQTHAVRWSGNAASHLDIHPNGAGTSVVYGAGDGQAVGDVDGHAALWAVDGLAYIDLHPAGASSSYANAAHGGMQAGVVDGRAALWAGASDTMFDLGATLPAEFAGSVAEDFEIAPDGSVAVVGYAYNTVTGRYEALVWFSVGTPCPGDLDGDADVDVSDLGLVLAEFGCASGCTADADGDGDVDVSDLGIVLANFGATCP